LEVDDWITGIKVAGIFRKQASFTKSGINTRFWKQVLKRLQTEPVYISFVSDKKIG